MAYAMRTPEAAFAKVWEAIHVGDTAGSSHDDTPENVAAHLWADIVDVETPAPSATSTLTVTFDHAGNPTSAAVVSADGSIFDATSDAIRLGIARLTMAGGWEGSMTATGNADGWYLETTFTGRGAVTASAGLSFGRRIVTYEQGGPGGTNGEVVAVTFTADAGEPGNILPPTCYVAPAGRDVTVVYSLSCTDPIGPLGIWPFPVEADPDTPEHILHKLWYSYRKRRDAMTEYEPVGPITGGDALVYEYVAGLGEFVLDHTGADVTSTVLASSQSTGTIGLNLSDGWYRFMGFQPVINSTTSTNSVTATVRGFAQVIAANEYGIWQEALHVVGGVGHIGIAFGGGGAVTAFLAYITPLDLTDADLAILDYWS